MATKRTLGIVVSQLLYAKHPEVFDALRDAGHTVTCADYPEHADLILGKTSHFMDDHLIRLIDVAVSRRQKEKYV